MNLNKVQVIGRLTRNPEVKKLDSGMSVASFSLAVNNVYKDKAGNKVENAEFVNVVVFGNQADNCGEWLKKGQECYVEGRLQTRSWDGEDGQKKYRTEVIADRVQFGSRANSEGSPTPTPDGTYTRMPQGEVVTNLSKTELTKTQKEFARPAMEYPTEEINPEDIPF